MVRGEEAATTATVRRRTLTSAVWASYTINRPADGGDGGAETTATCLRCGRTLCAGGTNGTSHLRRHTKSKNCRQLAAEREAEVCRRWRQPTSSSPTAGGADEPSPAGGGDEEKEVEDWFTVDGIYIPKLYDKLIAEGLVIDQSREPAEHFSATAASNYVPAVAQAASSSTRWFMNKTKERRQVKKAENKKR